MRISEQYFQDLLNSNDTLSAVFALDRDWCAREGVSWNSPQFGMSKPEFTVHLCILYLGEVSNGGHEQFFLNPIGRWAWETVEALIRVNLLDLAEILRLACSLFPEAVIPVLQDEREQTIRAMSADKIEQWGQLDRRLYAADQKAFNMLLNYLRENQSQVLVQERG